MKLLRNSTLLFLINIILIFIAIYSSSLITRNDLGQIVTVFYMFFPAIALLSGILARSLTKKFWIPPLITALAFTFIVLIRYNSGGLIYVLFYTLINILGYLIGIGIEKTYSRIKSKSE